MLEAAPVGPDTPDFQNLDFEQMAICPTNGSGLFDTALPFWTCYGMAGTNPLSGVLYNNFCLGSACISLHGPFDPWPVDSGVRHGSFYVYLQAGLGANGHDHLTTTIAQSGIVPANARSLLLNASWGGLEVSFNGTPIPMRTLTSGGGYYVLSGNVGPYAGQFGELRFTAPWVWYQNIPMQGPIEVALDYIRFSALPPVGLPSISTQPFSQTAEAGLQVQLAVRASGELPLVYRWIFNETNVLSISTNSFLELTNVDVSLAGSYTVVVTNAVGAVTSAPAMLNVIAPVQRRMVPRLTLSGQLAMPFNLEHSETLAPTQYWTSLVSMDLTNSPGFYFDLASPLPPQRFYRAWQVTMPTNQSSLGLNMIPAITLTGSPGNRIRVEGINQFGPTDAWFTLAAVTLTNTSQLYFDVTAPGQPARLYRLVPVP